MSCGHGSPGGSPALSPSRQPSTLPLLPAQQHQGCWFKHEISCWGPQQQETKCRASAGQGDPQPQDPPPRGLWWPHRARGMSRSLLRCCCLVPGGHPTLRPSGPGLHARFVNAHPRSASGLGWSPAITPNHGELSCRGGIQYPQFIIPWSKRNGGDLSISCWAGPPVGRVQRWLGLALAPGREMGRKEGYLELT